MYLYEQLVAEKRKKGRIKYLFFWGHTPKKDTEIDKSCFSQWWPSEFTDGEHVYRTAEHYMMAKKALLFKDQEAFEKILLAKSPAAAKKLGRTVRNFDPVVWDEEKLNIVVEGNRLKFSQDQAMKGYLIGTGNRVLVEASPYDKIWGIGMMQDDEHAENPLMWKGENLLGFALMEVRKILTKS